MTILTHRKTPESATPSPAGEEWSSGCGWLWSQLHKPLLDTTDYFDLSFELKESGSKPVCAIAATTTTATISRHGLGVQSWASTIE